MRHDSIAAPYLSAASHRTPTTASGIVTRPTRRPLLFSELASRHLAEPRTHRSEAHDADGITESYTRVHLFLAFGFFGSQPSQLGFIAAKRQEGEGGLPPQSPWGCCMPYVRVRGQASWCARNPGRAGSRSRAEPRNLDIRFLDVQDLASTARWRPCTDERGTTERVLHLHRPRRPGLRRGELLSALRWQDIDWAAGVVRVCCNYTRGQFGTPELRRSSRAVPLAQRVRDELGVHYERSLFQAPADLVFCHPQLGVAIDPAQAP